MEKLNKIFGLSSADDASPNFPPAREIEILSEGNPSRTLPSSKQIQDVRPWENQIILCWNEPMRLYNDLTLSAIRNFNPHLTQNKWMPAVFFQWFQEWFYPSLLGCMQWKSESFYPFLKKFNEVQFPRSLEVDVDQLKGKLDEILSMKKKFVDAEKRSEQMRHEKEKLKYLWCSLFGQIEKMFDEEEEKLPEYIRDLSSTVTLENYNRFLKDSLTEVQDLSKLFPAIQYSMHAWGGNACVESFRSNVPAHLLTMIDTYNWENEFRMKSLMLLSAIEAGQKPDFVDYRKSDSINKEEAKEEACQCLIS
mmetsp:Transcript_15259/g.19537  ORF Transcript_15259/g.19537 Transcript_15259/m.19537 type:complete len:307 (-) Transcript_15259:19-939(-)